ncbi:MAG TPA: DUF998 domain-containing protein [Candidatus Dormibacteraeota bacterium]|nr:DUF998 domain-containing protein [Candidatus Dormibacteraeota bacterium]
MASSVVPRQAVAEALKPYSAVSDRPSVAQRVAGVLLMVPGVGLVMGWLTAEALYPQTYTTHTNSLSNLGATEPPNSVALQPSAGIFDVTVLIAGLMLIGAAYFTFRAFEAKRVSIPIALLGLGVFGVGIFPLTNPTAHTLVAIVAFYCGGIAVILASTIAAPVFRYIWIPLGVVSLAAITLAFFAQHWAPIASLGLGGIERWNTYPIVLWLIAFGSYLMTGCAITARRRET